MCIKCSIIIPAYNAEKEIADCLTSIQLDKKWKHEIEVIVVNDGSLDRTKEVVLSWGEKYKSIKFHEQKNSGVSAARNAGLKMASGKYVYFMDSDDLLFRETLDEMVECAETEDIHLILANYYTHNTINDKVEYVSCGLPVDIKLGREYIEKNIFLRYLIGDDKGLSSLWNKLFSVEIIRNNNIFFDVNRTHGEDWKFVIDYLEHISYIYTIDKYIYTYRIDGSQNFKKYSKQLAYSLLDGHRVVQKLIKKYQLCNEKTREYEEFMKRFYYQIIEYVSLKNCVDKEKKTLS